jgi:hypothetical protein
MLKEDCLKELKLEQLLFLVKKEIKMKCENFKKWSDKSWIITRLGLITLEKSNWMLSKMKKLVYN